MIHRLQELKEMLKELDVYIEDLKSLKVKLDNCVELLEKELTATSPKEDPDFLPDPEFSFTYESVDLPVEDLTGEDVAIDRVDGLFESIDKVGDPAMPKVSYKTNNRRAPAKSRMNRDRRLAKTCQAVCSKYAAECREYYHSINKDVTSKAVDEKINDLLNGFLDEYNSIHGTTFIFTNGKSSEEKGLVHKPRRKAGYWEALVAKKS